MVKLLIQVKVERLVRPGDYLRNFRCNITENGSNLKLLGEVFFESSKVTDKSQ